MCDVAGDNGIYGEFNILSTSFGIELNSRCGTNTGFKGTTLALASIILWVQLPSFLFCRLYTTALYLTSDGLGNACIPSIFFASFGNRHRRNFLLPVPLMLVVNSSHEKLPTSSMGTSRTGFFLQGRSGKIFPGNSYGEKNPSRSYKLKAIDMISLCATGLLGIGS